MLLVAMRIAASFFFSTYGLRGSIMKEDQNPRPGLPTARGPRTLGGKKHSRKNALSHGIYAKQLLLDDERLEDFSSLCRDLQETLGAKGALEEQLILQLAMLLLRNRRLLKAETAEIKKAAEFVGFDRGLKRNVRVPDYTDEVMVQRVKLLDLISNIELLTNLRYHFENRGFNKEEDLTILHKIYGLDHLEEGFPYLYILFNSQHQDSAARAELSRKHGDLRKKTFELIDQELACFEFLKNQAEKIESKFHGFAQLTSLVPPHEVHDRLLRCETHLSRETDRVLTRLERAKRLRRGSPSPPSITLTRE